MATQIQVENVPISELGSFVPDPTNPRKDFSAIGELQKSIAANGILERLKVIRLKDGTRLTVVGNSRLAALHRMLPGQRPQHIPVEYIEATPDQRLMLHWHSNMVRKDLSKWEIVNEVEQCSRLGFTNEQISDRLQISMPLVTQLMFLTKLPQWVKNAGLSGKISTTLAYGDLKVECDGSVEDVTKMLEEKREQIETLGVTAQHFEFPKSNFKKAVVAAKKAEKSGKKAPATQAPVGQAPATQAPVDQAPATQAPVGQAPTTQAPVGQAPATQAPVGQAPATQAPVGQATTTQAPETLAENTLPAESFSAQTAILLEKILALSGNLEPSGKDFIRAQLRESTLKKIATMVEIFNSKHDLF